MLRRKNGGFELLTPPSIIGKVSERYRRSIKVRQSLPTGSPITGQPSMYATRNSCHISFQPRTPIPTAFFRTLRSFFEGKVRHILYSTPEGRIVVCYQHSQGAENLKEFIYNIDNDSILQAAGHDIEVCGWPDALAPQRSDPSQAQAKALIKSMMRDWPIVNLGVSRSPGLTCGSPI